MAAETTRKLDDITTSVDAIRQILERISARQEEKSPEEASELKSGKMLFDAGGSTTGKIDKLLGKFTTIASALGSFFTLDKQSTQSLAPKITPVADQVAPTQQQQLPRASFDDTGTAADEDRSSQNTIPESVVDEKGPPPERKITNWEDLGPIISKEFAANRKEEEETRRLGVQKETSAVMGSPEGGGGGMMSGLLGMAAIFAAVMGKKLLGFARGGVKLVKHGVDSAAKRLKGLWGGVKNKWNSLWGKDKPEVVKKDGARAFKRGTSTRAPTLTAKEIPKKMPWYKKAWEGTKSVASKTWKGAGKIATKAGGKSLLKKIPGVGLVAGGIFGAQRALQGDWAGGAAELASGAASVFPGVGTGVSVAIDAGLAARDIAKENKAEEETPLLPETSQLAPGSPLFKEGAPIQIPKQQTASAVQPWFPSPAVGRPRPTSVLPRDISPAGVPSRSSIVMSTAGDTGKRTVKEPLITKEEVKKTVSDIITETHVRESVITKAAEPLKEKPDIVQPVGEEVPDVTDTVQPAADIESPKATLSPVAKTADVLKTFAQRYNPMAPKETDTGDGDKGVNLVTIEDHLGAIRRSVEDVNENIAGMRREFPESVAAIPGGGQGPHPVAQQGANTLRGETQTQYLRQMVRNS